MRFDLHGVRHEFVEREVLGFLSDAWCKRNVESIEIVTGHSDKMKDLVIEVLNRFCLSYTVGDILGRQTASIFVEVG